MPRPIGRMSHEKSKDFFGSMKRLFRSLNKWSILLIISLVLAMTSSVLSIIAPNILSDFTDAITEGIKLDTEQIKNIAEIINMNLANIDYKNKTLEIMSSTEISKDDKEKFQLAFEQLNTKDPSTMLTFFSKLPDSTLRILIPSIELKDKEVNYKDQITFLTLLSKVDNNSSSEDMLDTIEKLPKPIYEYIEPHIQKNKINKISSILILIYISSALFSYIQSFTMATISNNFAKNMRTNINKKINRLPLKYFDNHETGDILSRITNDVDIIGMNMNQSLATLVSSTTLFIGSVIMMFATEWRMALTAIISSIFGFALMIKILKKSQKYFNEKQTNLGNLNGFIEEMYSGHIVVKSYNGEKKAIEDFKELNEKLYECNRKSQFLSGIMQPLMAFTGNLGYVCVCVLGAILVSNNIITFGVIVAFMIYIRLFTNPLSQIAQAMTALQSTAAASERVFEFLDEKELTNEENLKSELKKRDVRGQIEFKNVKFGYRKDKTIIKNFNAKIKPGQKVAIVGPTGAGKTTLVNLLMKFYEIDDGDILIDGISIKDLKRENIHDLFVMVLQDTWLFDGSIADNIRFNKNKITDDMIWQACKFVGIDHFVKTLPMGLNSEVGNDDSISQGQKQLLTITRGMIENAPLLILDEATSNVDTRTEELVQKAMDKLMVGRTSFIIAHRLSTIKNADLILVMKDGDIIESGKHDELMKQDGFYADLYNSQFEL